MGLFFEKPLIARTEPCSFATLTLFVQFLRAIGTKIWLEFFVRESWIFFAEKNQIFTRRFFQQSILFVVDISLLVYDNDFRVALLEMKSLAKMPAFAGLRFFKKIRRQKIAFTLHGGVPIILGQILADGKTILKWKARRVDHARDGLWGEESGIDAPVQSVSLRFATSPAGKVSRTDRLSAREPDQRKTSPN